MKTICVELQKLATMVGKAKNMSAIHLPPPIIKDHIEVYIFLFAWISVFVPRRDDYGIFFLCSWFECIVGCKWRIVVFAIYYNFYGVH